MTHQDMRPRRVAIVANNLHTYQIKIVCGIRDVLRDNGVDALLILGQALRPPNTGTTPANDIYDLIDARNFCGVIVLSTVVGPQISDQALSAWIQRFALPVVSIGRPLEQAGNVLIDNVPGMSALMTHLLDTMGYRRLAMLRGIPGNADSDEREAVFRSSLEHRGLPVEEDLLMTGDFASVKAFRLVQQLLERRRDVQAIVCANDDMADGCVRAINAAGLRVPQDIAVTGFDDAIHHVVPALTTVRMPVYEQGREAALMLLAMLQAPTSPVRPDTRVLLAELVVRDSCGAGEGTSRRSRCPAPPRCPPTASRAIWRSPSGIGWRCSTTWPRTRTGTRRFWKPGTRRCPVVRSSRWNTRCGGTSSPVSSTATASIPRWPGWRWPHSRRWQA
ncbi:LacI family DNA-binding transcriptional regulator [Roseateles chitinivorans]|uniref:LacI family DNA-binding transcriptional regulator n=1 Tax=Roseateles chitinivorans TaxID=2917965 RepID=UPI003D67DC32